MTALVHSQEFLVEASLAGAGYFLARELVEEEVVLSLFDEEQCGFSIELAILGL